MMDLKRKYWSDILLAMEAIDHHLVGIDSFELYSAAPTINPGLCSRVRCEGRKRKGTKGFVEEE